MIWVATGGNKFLFIEGTTDDTNGNLREGFYKLLYQRLKDNMPRIRMGNNTRETIGKYKACQSNSYALIDLDDFEANKKTAMDKYEINDSDQVFFMIQEMEAWFISQPDILDEYYGFKISEKLIKKNAKEFKCPDEYLQDLTKQCKKGRYHKVRHGVELLKKLDANKLQNYFSEFDTLIRKIEEA